MGYASLNQASFSPDISLQTLAKLPFYWKPLAYYISFIVGVEFLLRIATAVLGKDDEGKK